MYLAPFPSFWHAKEVNWAHRLAAGQRLQNDWLTPQLKAGTLSSNHYGITNGSIAIFQME
jgi:hypothetical protein